MELELELELEAGPGQSVVGRWPGGAEIVLVSGQGVG